MIMNQIPFDTRDMSVEEATQHITYAIMQLRKRVQNKAPDVIVSVVSTMIQINDLLTEVQLFKEDLDKITTPTGITI